MIQPRQLSRQQLYDLIWARPMTKIAADLGISDVGLKKICVKHRIPVPHRGYWAKVAAGKSVTQAQLHPVSDPAMDRIVIHGASELRLPTEVRQARREVQVVERRPESKVAVAGRSAPSHPVAMRLAKALKEAKADGQGRVSASGSGYFEVSVAPVSVGRAVAIVDALARAAEERGHLINVSDRGARLHVGQEAVGFRLFEKVGRHPHRPTPEEIAREERMKRSRTQLDRFSFTPSPPEWDYRPTGLLVLQLNEHYHCGLRRTWADGKTRRLEELLNDVLAGVVAYAAADKARREEHERRERAWQEEQRRRAEEERQRRREASRWKFLEELIEAWEQTDRIDRFVNAVRAQISDEDMASRKLHDLLSWARRHAAALRQRTAPEAIAAVLFTSDLFDPDDGEAGSRAS